MNKNLFKIIDSLKPEKLKNDRRIFVFAACLLIATVLWFLNALEKDYSTTLTYSVKYVNPPRNLYLASTPPDRLRLNVQAHGFTLLRHKLSFSFSPIVFDLTTIFQSMQSPGKTVLISTENLIRRVENQITKEFSITDVSPNSILFVFDSLQMKKVPVTPDVNLSFSPQFYLTDSITVEPDSVEISGPVAVLDTIQYLSTETVALENLGTTVERTVNIQNPPYTNLAPEKVALRIPVERFTEKSLTLPIQVINKPDNVDLKLFPNQVNVVVSVGLTAYEKITASDFLATVDFNQITIDKETVEIQIEKQPGFIQLKKVSPLSVEYLIETE